MERVLGSGPTNQEVQNEDGSLRVTRSSQGTVYSELHGAIGLEHVKVLTSFMDTCFRTSPVKLSLFQDLTAVSSYDMEAQVHMAEWARAHAEHMDRLHFAIDASLTRGSAGYDGSSLLVTVRSMFMSLPIRAYLYESREALQGALTRAS